MEQLRSSPYATTHPPNTASIGTVASEEIIVIPSNDKYSEDKKTQNHWTEYNEKGGHWRELIAYKGGYRERFSHCVMFYEKSKCKLHPPPPPP